MSGYNYVGRTPANPQDLANKLTVANLIAAATPSPTSAASDVLNAANLKAGKVYVDSLTGSYSSRSYYPAQDALNIPLAGVGKSGGAAALDASGKIPLAQLPAVGAGYVLGPFGPTAGYAGSTDSTPLKIADWDIGVAGIHFEPQVRCNLVCSASNMGRPVVEIGISNGSSLTYAAQTIIARGTGRSFWNDGQVITTRPVPTGLAHQGPDPTIFTPTYHVFCSAWLWDSQGQTVTVADGGIISGAVLLWRTEQ